MIKKNDGWKRSSELKSDSKVFFRDTSLAGIKTNNSAGHPPWNKLHRVVKSSIFVFDDYGESKLICFSLVYNFSPLDTYDKIDQNLAVETPLKKDERALKEKLPSL